MTKTKSDAENVIDHLLRKYAEKPEFPFNDWVENEVSFYALINIWDEIFKTAAGKFKDSYKALGDAEQDKDSYIYQVRHLTKNVVFNVNPTWPASDNKIGGDFGLLHTVYSPELQPMEDKYELGVMCDLDRDRLICIFQIIQEFTHNLPTSKEELVAMNDEFIEKYGKFFGFPDYNPWNSPLFPITEDDDDDEE